MKLRSVIATCLLLAAVIGTFSLASPALANGPQATTSISFVVTTTTNYLVTTGGQLQVYFDSVQLTSAPPQAYSFGAVAKTNPGFWITRLHWEFGDGAFLDVPYCCQSQVSEVQNHAYAQPGSYTIVLLAFDNAGSYGDAIITVNWATPVPEYPAYGLPLVISLFAVLVAATYTKGKFKPFRTLFR